MTTTSCWRGRGGRGAEHCPDPASDVALIQYTCGTTGISKGAMLTHFNLVATTLQVRETLAATCCRGQDRVLVTLPLFHVYGMTLGMNLALSIAGTQVLLPRFDAGAVLKAINDYRPTISRGTPYMFTSLLNHPRLADFRPLLPESLYQRLGPAVTRGGEAFRGPLREAGWWRATGLRRPLR